MLVVPQTYAQYNHWRLGPVPEHRLVMRVAEAWGYPPGTMVVFLTGWEESRDFNSERYRQVSEVHAYARQAGFQVNNQKV